VQGTLKYVTAITSTHLTDCLLALVTVARTFRLLMPMPMPHAHALNSDTDILSIPPVHTPMPDALVTTPMPSPLSSSTSVQPAC
jgi:hypothetical protein